MAEEIPDWVLQIKEDDEPGGPPPLAVLGPDLLWSYLDAVHLALDWIVCNDPRNSTLEFCRDLERAIDRLADIQAHLRPWIERKG